MIKPPLFFVVTGILIVLFLYGCANSDTEKQNVNSDIEMTEHFERITEHEEAFFSMMDDRSASPEFKPRGRFLAEEYRIFATRYPEHPQAAEMLFKAANIQADVLDSYTNAIFLFNKIAQTWPGTIQAERSLFLAGYTYNYFLDDESRAIRAYESLIERYPESALADAARDEISLMGTSVEDLLRSMEFPEN
ncbi:MAG: tetratricopeptide repeat protein [Balneolales bacterium]|nr:tetratricopeptide repeat protein [Balneolales bacterium]